MCVIHVCRMCAYTHMHVYICVCVCAGMCACLGCVHTYMHVCALHMYIHILAHLYRFIYIRTCAVCAHTCACTYIYTCTHTCTHTQAPLPALPSLGCLLPRLPRAHSALLRPHAPPHGHPRGLRGPVGSAGLEGAEALQRHLLKRPPFFHGPAFAPLSRVRRQACAGRLWVLSCPTAPGALPFASLTPP